MRRARRILGLMVMAVWAVTISARVTEWQDDLLLWGSAVQHAPLRGRPQINFAGALVRHGFTQQAVIEYGQIAAKAEEVEAAIVAARNKQRLHVKREDLQKWFSGDPNAAVLFSLSVR